jgi:hypothetical protein
MITEFTSLEPVEQRRIYNIILSEFRTTTLVDRNKRSYNLEAVIALSFCKIYRFVEFTSDFSVDWSNLSRLLPDADYYAEYQLNTANFPRGRSHYHVYDIDQDVTLHTVVDKRINDIINMIYDREDDLLLANSKGLEIINKYTIPEGMRNRFFQFPAAAILHRMRIELQFNSQLGAMDVVTRAQKDFAVLVINRQIQNRVLSVNSLIILVLRTRMIKEFTSLEPVEQRRIYDRICLSFAPQHWWTETSGPKTWKQ